VDLKKIIKDAVRDDRAILGYDKTMKELKTKKPKMIIHANNLPKEKLENITHNSKLLGVDVKEYPDDNVNLGLFCGKPFSVSVLAIKGSEK